MSGDVSHTLQMRNLPLACGLLLVLLLLGAAVAGPLLAPFDPLERIGAVRTERGFIGPPFPPLTPGFVFGSDRYGRDLLSRVLWGIRPTLLMVTVVAGIRLLSGLLIGVVAGWARGWAGRSAATLIGAALALPTLFVALATITLIGPERGLPAFMFGLAVTGWADTARLAAEQTRLIRRQAYIEAAQVLGAGDAYLLVRHLPRHVLPLVGMLLAFEISATLMLTVALGFLGYYIGGGVWVIMSGDAVPVAERTTDYPELGQMLSTVLEHSLDPWPMVVVGATVFVAILGFNLLGEGLRRQAETIGGTRSPAGRAIAWALRPAERGALVLAMHGRATLIMLLAVVFVTAAIVAGQIGEPQTDVVDVPQEALPVAGGHMWGSGRRDAGWTRDAAWPATAAPGAIQVFQYGGSMVGAPVIDTAGRIIFCTRQRLYVIDADGTPLWDTPLARVPAGGPALGIDGSIYVVDTGARLLAFGPEGEQRWEFQARARGEATSGPVVGPDGVIYYTMIDRVQAVDMAGHAIWVSATVDSYLEEEPRLTADGELVLLRASAFGSDGSAQPYRFEERADAFSDPHFLVGADGGNYYRSGHRVVAWQPQGNATETLYSLSWEGSRVTIGYASDTGVARNGTAWMLYAGGLGDARLVWIGRDGVLLGNLPLGQRRSQVVAVGAAAELVICGIGAQGAECGLFVPGMADAGWRLPLGAPGQVVGGALTDEQLIVTTDAGALVIVWARSAD
ncbi:MAG TPA: ABC transporter permease subunit [Roseiflexaceae bacterium]|nr:ABC transporter permease subunit [Roseiflexaceae bacterium]HMP39923.1 ABC transporter permease subunit [Roseiflexaceae bacterium]